MYGEGASTRSPFRTERVPGAHGDAELAVGVCGDALSDPVVALHGISAHHRAFNALARRISGERTMIAPDLRGRGNSQKPEVGYGLDAHTDDVVRTLDHFGLESVRLVGHSMGAFVALRTALSYPDRVSSLVLLDGGWPRQEILPEGMTEDQAREAEAVRQGLARAFSRLDMTFESPEDYLEFWFPGQALKPADLPPDVADYFLYDLEEVEGGFSPKCSLAAATQDSESVAERAPTTAELREVGCPVALVCAGAGFFPESEPLISEEVRNGMSGALDLRSQMRLPGANHYTLLYEPNVAEFAGLLTSRDPQDWAV
jgi:pimeloyl-ACP methyl ester carboxylesterase